MNSTRIILRGGNTLNPIVEVNGVRVPITKDKYGNRYCQIDTENNFCQLRIYTLKHELSEPYWWLFSFLFYIVSICGLLNTFYSKKFYTLDYVGTINASIPVLDLQFSRAQEAARAINCLQGQFDDNATNFYGFDKVAKKRKRLLFWLKIISWVAIVATVVIVMLLK